MATNQCLLHQDKLEALALGQSRLEERVKSVESHHVDTTGLLTRVEDKVDRLQWWIIGILLTACGSLIVALATLSLMHYGKK